MLSCHPDAFGAFCRDLYIKGCETHLYRGPNSFGCVLPSPAKMMAQPTWTLPSWWNTENVYFLAGVVPHITKRAADADVRMRSMFTLDFDIRKEIEKNSKIPVPDSLKDVTITLPMDEAIARAGDAILQTLENHPIFGQFRYMVYSGNGMHLHYFGYPVAVKKDEWAAGMRELFAEVNAITPIPCDTGCGNAGRIMRMPGSWNVKDPKNKKPVTVEAWMPNSTLGDLAWIQERGRAALAKQEERKAAERAEFAATHPDGPSNVIDLINAIPIEQVVSQLFAGLHVRAVKKDGGMRFADESGVERGFFRHAHYNVIVHEGTSLFPAPSSGTAYNCLSLAKEVLHCDAAQAIEWFAQRSARVREERRREREEYVAEHAAKAVELYDIRNNTPLPSFL